MNKYQEALDYVKCHPVCGEEDEIENCEICEIKNNCIMNNNIKLIQELVDKATPKEPLVKKYKNSEHYLCPNCNSIIILDSRKPKQPKRCEECDQLLDWSDTNV